METPKCNECGREMEEWGTLGVYYCKRCSIIYDPKQDEYWHTEEQEEEEEGEEES